MQHCVGEDLDISRYDSTSSSSGKDEMQVVPVGRGYVLRQSACNRPGTVEDELVSFVRDTHARERSAVQLTLINFRH
jgi:hypothetical protein